MLLADVVHLDPLPEQPAVPVEGGPFEDLDDDGFPGRLDVRS